MPEKDKLDREVHLLDIHVDRLKGLLSDAQLEKLDRLAKDRSS